MAFNPKKVTVRTARPAPVFNSAALSAAGLRSVKGVVQPTLSATRKLLGALYSTDDLHLNTDNQEVSFGTAHGEDAIPQLISELEVITGVRGWYEKAGMVEDAVRLRHYSPHAAKIMAVSKTLPLADLSPWTELTMDPAFTDEAIRMMMYGYVQRAFRPGSKFDYAIILVGRQGIGKTTFNDDLFPGRSAGYEYDDRHPTETAAQHERIVLEEASDELFRHDRFNRLKDRISLTIRGDDVKYVRGRQQMSARAVYTGSSNEYKLFMPGLDGLRRFLIIVFRPDVKDFMPRLMHETWEQLISEALRRFDAEEEPVLPPEAARRQQRALDMVTRSDEDTEMVRFHVSRLLNAQGYFQKAELQDSVAEDDLNLRGPLFTRAWRKISSDYAAVSKRIDGRVTRVFVPVDDLDS